MTSPLRRVALRRPGPALLQADASVWHYGPSFDPQKVVSEHKSFAELINAEGVEVIWMDSDDLDIADAVFTYDASLMTAEGAILMSPGKALRHGEQDLHRQFYLDNDIPILGEISGEGRAEAGDTLWLGHDVIAIGRGFRTNPDGIEQLKQCLISIGVTVHVFDLPFYQGAAACLHLMSLVSLVDTKTALVCAPLLPVGLWQLMQKMGYELIEAPFTEFEQSNTLSVNVLALAPGECVMVDGFLRTRQELENAGINVRVYSGWSLSIGCEGGPTCLTRPILRQNS